MMTDVVFVKSAVDGEAFALFPSKPAPNGMVAAYAREGRRTVVDLGFAFTCKPLRGVFRAALLRELGAAGYHVRPVSLRAAIDILEEKWRREK